MQDHEGFESFRSLVAQKSKDGDQLSCIMKIGYRAHIVQPKSKRQGGAEISSIRTTKQATPGPINGIGEATHRFFFTAGMHDTTVKTGASYLAFCHFCSLDS